MRSDEVLPKGLLSTFRRRRQAVPLQYIGHGLMADFVSQIAQGTDNPPVSPTAILPSQLEYQLDRLAGQDGQWTFAALNRRTSLQSTSGATRESFPVERSAPPLTAPSCRVACRSRLD